MKAGLLGSLKIYPLWPLQKSVAGCSLLGATGIVAFFKNRFIYSLQSDRIFSLCETSPVVFPSHLYTNIFNHTGNLLYNLILRGDKFRR